MANKTIKIRLCPSEEQKVLFQKTFGCCRKIWNLMLNDKNEHYKEHKETLYTTPAQYKKVYPYLKEVDSLALCNVQINLQTAYKNFFKNPKQWGFPKLKSKKSGRKSYTTNNQNGTIELYDKSIKLPKIGVVKAVVHRVPLSDWKLKSATISQDSDGKYYASVLFEYDTNVAQISKNSNNAIGLDYKSDGLYVDSNNNCCNMPHYYRQSEVKLGKQQRKLRHKVVGSNNYNKQQQRIAKVHKKIANQRKDFLHKTSTEIANQYDIVCAETLNMKAISNKGFYLGKATLDNGYGMFLQMLEYKLLERGKHFIKVDKFYPSSQICSCCGNRKKVSLEERVYKCSCGFVLDRDYNAAINILREGLNVLRAAA